MLHKRTDKKGSFGGHFDELVQHFPHDDAQAKRRALDPRSLKEKRDIHALLFERAWRMERRDR